ncbi:MAG TPA: hypothetical protein VFZ00_16345 [Solirubrobacter sp.]|nr:hypothetical protein [Solirubrobacter sp.]
MLTDRGLRDALNALAYRAAVPVDLAVDLPAYRLPIPIEAAACFTVCEGLTNVAEYAEATRAWVHVARHDSHLDVEVGGDGIGGADVASGSGLLGLRDRIAAVTVIKTADVTAAPVQAAIQRLHDRALASGELSEPSAVDISPDKTVAVVALSNKGSGTDAASERSLEVLRSDVVPATVGKLAGAEVAVTGMTAMKLLGARNWYLPKHLGWLPKLEHEPAVAPA